MKMSVKQLYKISDDYKGLMALVDSGEATQEMISDSLEGVESMFEEKANAVVTIANGFDNSIDIVDAEIKRLTAMKQSLASQKGSLTEYLRHNMERTGINKIQCPLFTITLRKASQPCHINDESELPDEYVNVKTTISPDKREILKALKAGAEIPGAEISTGKTSIIIK